MKKILIILLLLPAISFSQSIEKLDIKNGFLQFRLGDSLSHYKSMMTPIKNRPGYYEAKRDAKKFKGFVDNVTLYFEDDRLSNIEIEITRESDIKFMDNALKSCYGEGTEIKNGNEGQQGWHKTLTIWSGKRVSLAVKKIALVGSPGGVFYSGGTTTIDFKKISDENIAGQLEPGFIL